MTAVIENYQDITGTCISPEAVKHEAEAEEEEVEVEVGHKEEEMAPAMAAVAAPAPPPLALAQPTASNHSEPCGLDFLLQACDILEPGTSSGLDSKPTSANRRRGGGGGGGGEQVTSRGRRTRRPSDEGEFQYSPGHSSEEDEDYRPVRRSTNSRPSRRSSTAHTHTGNGNARHTQQQQQHQNHQQQQQQQHMSTVRWERGMVTGPCTNPDCEHPYDSPQWRKGPPTNPILCNACGTRWLRNGTLKPLVPRRGIRYGKARPKGSVKAAAQARADAAAARAAKKEAAMNAVGGTGTGTGTATPTTTATTSADQQRSQMTDDDVVMAGVPGVAAAPTIKTGAKYEEINAAIAATAAALAAPGGAVNTLQYGRYDDPVVLETPPSPKSMPSMAIDSSAALLNAMAAVYPGLYGFPASTNPMHPAAPAPLLHANDPAVLQQQLTAMAAAAQAAQHAYLAAQAAMVHAEQQGQLKAHGQRPDVFNINAHAGPAPQAPLWTEGVNSAQQGAQAMQEDR